MSEINFEQTPIANKGKVLTPTGSIGSIVTVLFCPICKPGIAIFLSSVGLGFVVHESILRSILILFLLATMGGLFWSYIKVHRNLWPIIVGAIMSIGLYLGRYGSFDNIDNGILTYGSVAGLIGVSVWNIFLRKPVSCNSCKCEIK